MGVASRYVYIIDIRITLQFSYAYRCHHYRPLLQTLKVQKYAYHWIHNQSHGFLDVASCPQCPSFSFSNSLNICHLACYNTPLKPMRYFSSHWIQARLDYLWSDIDTVIKSLVSWEHKVHVSGHYPAQSVLELFDIMGMMSQASQPIPNQMMIMLFFIVRDFGSSHAWKNLWSQTQVYERQLYWYITFKYTVQ